MSSTKQMISEIYQSRIILDGEASAEKILKELNHGKNLEHYKNTRNTLTAGAAVIGATIGAKFGFEAFSFMADHMDNAILSGKTILSHNPDMKDSLLAPMSLLMIVAPLGMGAGAAVMTHESQQTYSDNKNKTFTEKIANKIGDYFSNARREAVIDFISKKNGVPRDQVFERSIAEGDKEAIAKHAVDRYLKGLSWDKDRAASNKREAKFDSQTINMSKDDRQSLEAAVNILEKRFGKEGFSNDYQKQSVIDILETAGPKGLDKDQVKAIKERAKDWESQSHDTGLAHSM